MSEPIPESIPTSADRRSNRPVKKQRGLTPSSQQSAQVNALFKNPDREISTDGPKARSLAAPPEIVANVQGSSAGAGSGEFHVYKASRRREYERLRAMDEEAAKEKADAEFEEKQAKVRREEEERLGKNRARREKAKARQQKKKIGGKEEGGDVDGNGVVEAEGGGERALKRKLGPKKVDKPVNGAEKENGDVANKGEEQAPAEEGGGITFVDDD